MRYPKAYSIYLRGTVGFPKLIVRVYGLAGVALEGLGSRLIHCVCVWTCVGGLGGASKVGSETRIPKAEGRQTH